MRRTTEPSKNGYKVDNRFLRKAGYNWWWHSLVGRSDRTGLRQPFFVEYYVINPALGGDAPILGQAPENKAVSRRPSYAMIKAGTWKDGAAAQIHNFYGISAFWAGAGGAQDVRIGPHVSTETKLVGSVRLSAFEAAARPELMSDGGEMSWSLDVEKVLSYDVGWGSSRLARVLPVFQMYWHVEGMKTRYEGTIEYNGERFTVRPDECNGYQDSNWGRDYTVPWIWLSCNEFRSRETGASLPDTSLDVGGGCPRILGVPLRKRLLIAFHHGGELHEYNFSKPWTGSRETFDVKYTDKDLLWAIRAQNRRTRIEIDFQNPRRSMLCVAYENPRGHVHYRQLYNGGHAAGTVRLFRRAKGGDEPMGVFDGEMGAGEYGEA